MKATSVMSMRSRSENGVNWKNPSIESMNRFHSLTRIFGISRNNTFPKSYNVAIAVIREIYGCFDRTGSILFSGLCDSIGHICYFSRFRDIMHANNMGPVENRRCHGGAGSNGQLVGGFF